MRQDQLSGFITFVRVAELKSFSAAAIQLSVSPAAVSQNIRQLELRVGVPLFNRTTRSISLTEAGAKLLDNIKDAVHTLITATEELSDLKTYPSGLLRLNISRASHLTVVQPVLDNFLQTYPEVNVELALDNALVDIVKAGFDAGIRFGNLVEKDMVSVPVGPSLSVYIVASPQYLSQYGTPKHPLDLLSHQCIRFRLTSSGMMERWELEKNGEKMDIAVSGRLIVNDSSALVQAALEGIGIAYMDNGYIEHLIEQGKLVRVLSDWSPDLFGFSLYYPNRKRVSRSLRAFIDFLQSSRSRSFVGIDGVFK